MLKEMIDEHYTSRFKSEYRYDDVEVLDEEETDREESTEDDGE